MKRFSVVLLFGIAVLTALPVAAEPTSEPDPALRSAVATYWDAIAAADWSTTYGLEKSTQQGSEPIDPMTYYRRMESSPRYRTLNVESITQADATAKSIVSGQLVLPLGNKAFNIPRRFEAEWERIDQQWYHVATRVIPVVPPAAAGPDAAAASPSPAEPTPDGGDNGGADK
jgi:hypothetical protein